MRLKTLISVALLLAFGSVAYAKDSNCDGLYAGKAVKIRNVAPLAILSGPIKSKITGVDPKSGLVSIRTESGQEQETSCAELKANIVE